MEALRGAARPLRLQLHQLSQLRRHWEVFHTPSAVPAGGGFWDIHRAGPAPGPTASQGSPADRLPHWPRRPRRPCKTPRLRTPSKRLPGQRSASKGSRGEAPLAEPLAPRGKAPALAAELWMEVTSRRRATRLPRWSLPERIRRFRGCQARRLAPYGQARPTNSTTPGRGTRIALDVT